MMVWRDKAQIARQFSAPPVVYAAECLWQVVSISNSSIQLFHSRPRPSLEGHDAAQKKRPSAGGRGCLCPTGRRMLREYFPVALH